MKTIRRLIWLAFFLCSCWASKPIDYSVAIDSADRDNYFVTIDSIDSAIVRRAHVGATPKPDRNPRVERTVEITLFIMFNLIVFLTTTNRP